MKRVLITGMSGTGKSTLVAALAALGYGAVDTDYGYCHTGPDGEWVWREDLIQARLSTDDTDVLFVAGAASNQGRFYPQFDRIILLSAPAEVIVERLASRTNNPFGKTAEERARVLSDLATIEPLLRRSAHQEIDTRQPLEAVVSAVLRAIDVQR